MDLLSAQLVSLFVLLLGTFLCGTLPILCVKVTRCLANDEGTSSRRNQIMSFLIYLGGGVLMSTCFLHLLPESREEFDKFFGTDKSAVSNRSKTTEVERKEAFPIPEFVVLCGFFATYLIEEIIYWCLVYFQRDDSPQSTIRRRFCSCAQRHTECSRTFKGVKPDHSLIGLKKKHGGGSQAQGEFYAKRSPDEPTAAVTNELLKSSIIAQPMPNYGTVSTVTERANGDTDAVHLKPPMLVPGDDMVQQNQQVEQQEQQSAQEQQLSIGSILTVAALSFHSLFEGFAIGFQGTATDTWTLLLAVSMHKFVIAFVIGIEVLADGGRWFHIVSYIAVFSVMSPIGIMAAIFAQNSVAQMPAIVTGGVNCIACGTLLYVTFYEILRRKRHGGVSGFPRFLAVILGAALIAAVQFVTTRFSIGS